MSKKRKIYTMSELNLTMMKMFNEFNNLYFEGKLPKVIITFESGYKKGAYGWIWNKKTWEQSKEKRYNINISSDFLDRDVYAVLGTLLHEMCHLYALDNNIKDTSRAGIYHNKRFKQIAEEHGLTVTEEDKIGWGRTTVTEATKNFIDTHCNIYSFEIKKLRPQAKEDEESKPKQSTRKYICAHCGLKVRATKECKLICGNCFELNGNIPVYMNEE